MASPAYSCAGLWSSSPPESILSTGGQDIGGWPRLRARREHDEARDAVRQCCWMSLVPLRPERPGVDELAGVIVSTACGRRPRRSRRGAGRAAGGEDRSRGSVPRPPRTWTSADSTSAAAKGVCAAGQGGPGRCPSGYDSAAKARHVCPSPRARPSWSNCFPHMFHLELASREPTQRSLPRGLARGAWTRRSSLSLGLAETFGDAPGGPAGAGWPGWGGQRGSRRRRRSRTGRSLIVGVGVGRTGAGRLAGRRARAQARCGAASRRATTLRAMGLGLPLSWRPEASTRRPRSIVMLSARRGKAEKLRSRPTPRSLHRRRGRDAPRAAARTAARAPRGPLQAHRRGRATCDVHLARRLTHLATVLDAAKADPAAGAGVLPAIQRVIVAVDVAPAR